MGLCPKLMKLSITPAKVGIFTQLRQILAFGGIRISGRCAVMKCNILHSVTFFMLLLMLSACTLYYPESNMTGAEREALRAGEQITVAPKETVYAIARKHGVSMRGIIALNNLQPPYKLQVGQMLTLPAKGEDRYSGLDAAPVVTTKNGEPVAAPSGNIEESALPDITPPKSAPQAPSSSSDIKQDPPPSTPAVSNVPPPSPATSVTPPQETVRTEMQAAIAADVPAFVWPIQGDIISTFGSKGQGLQNDGINIAAPKGAPVTAAASGTVAYTGNGMKGFGNLVLIRHEGGWVTAYAHLDRVLVARDSVVAKNDMIGTVGTTGGAAKPQLHFELRQDGKPVDPKRFIHAAL